MLYRLSVAGHELAGCTGGRDMANKWLFWTRRDRKPADTRNDAGGLAYRLPARHALAQLAATGTLNSTFYVAAEDQLDRVLELATELAREDPAYVAKTAVFARRRGFMKDSPALLLAALAAGDDEAKGWLERAFPLVIDNGKMLRNFVQVVRSGVTGRRSLGSLPKRLVRNWLDERSDEQVFRASVGNSPSLRDILRMVHPRPATASRRALYAWLTGKDGGEEMPQVVRDYERFRCMPEGDVPDVPWLLLTSLPLTASHWQQVALRMGWQATRMNLNTLARHGVFESAEVTNVIAERLGDADEVRKARAFPYQLLAAWKHASANVPAAVARALGEATEVAVENVPSLDDTVHVCLDVSGSMGWSVTGFRRGSTSAVTCRETAALIAAAFVRRSRNATVVPFDDKVYDDPRDGAGYCSTSVLGLATELAHYGGGGTDCSLAMRALNKSGATGKLVVFVSDNESWMDSSGRHAWQGTNMLKQWEKYVKRNPGARLVCIDLVPNTTTQVLDREDVMNIGGFSDACFQVIDEFARGRLAADHWVGVIERTEVAA